MADLSPEEARKRLEEAFGGRIGMLAHMILTLSTSEQPCDVTFYKSKPALNVTIESKISLALMYGAGAAKLKEMLENIRLSDGQTVSINEIWMVLPMPAAGFSEEELAEVDLSEGEQVSGPNGETVREMIRNIYHCKSKEEEEKFLRRWLAS